MKVLLELQKMANAIPGDRPSIIPPVASRRERRQKTREEARAAKIKAAGADINKNKEKE